LSHAALIANYQAIVRQSAGQQVLAMVKADGYGHGAAWVASHLARQKQTWGFGVATLEEGVELRQSLSTARDPLAIVVFSGTTPWNERAGQTCAKHHLTPVISSWEDWLQFHRRRSTGRRTWSRQLPFEIKFNTGMNRLGMGLERLREISIDLLDLSSEGIYPSGILSHLALAEDAAAPLSLRQKAEFEALYGELAAIMPDSVDFHLSNSAAIWNHKKWAAGALTRRVRPGLALYGIESEIRKLQPQLTPVLNLEAPVILLHELHRGEALGYGGRFVAEKRERIATLGIGYAEGIPRAWSTSSSDARVLLGGKLQPFTGTISMDLCAVRASTSIKRGDWARILGEGIDPWKQARAAGTIPYELLTSISRRVQRIYE